MQRWTYGTQLAAHAGRRRISAAAVANPLTRLLRKAARHAIALCVHTHKAVRALEERCRSGPLLATHVAHVSLDHIRGNIGGGCPREGCPRDVHALGLEQPSPRETGPYGATRFEPAGPRKALAFRLPNYYACSPAYLINKRPSGETPMTVPSRDCADCELPKATVTIEPRV